MDRERRVGIIGYGRFGKLLALLLRDDFEVLVFDSEPATCEESGEGSPTFVDLETVLDQEVIFYCVPISSFERVLSEHVKYFERDGKERTLVDVLSVKLHPMEVFSRLLPDSCKAILTHPMFGPDTIRAQGVVGQRLVMDPFSSKKEVFEFWKSFFTRKELKVIEMTADEHDRLAAGSQGLAHFAGRVLGEFGIEPSSIDTLGAKKLIELKNLVCNDSWQLFVDLQMYNPYTREMRVRLGQAQQSVFDRLLPNREREDHLVIGLQGGKGSFNEEAAKYYLSRGSEKSYEFRYLHTTDRVLEALYRGEIDRGQFAIHNVIGGAVAESISAMARFRFEIVEQFTLKISHCLMISKEARFEDVDRVMAHPQVFRQCRGNLDRRYSRLRLESGEGELIDHAKVAELLSEGKLGSNIATMGSRALAEIYGLQIIEENLQDMDENYTSFLWVQRPAPPEISH